MAYPRKVSLAAAALAGLAATPALADGPVAADFAKTEAIIGAPSALAAILSQQGASRLPAPVQPASYEFHPDQRLRNAAFRTVGQVQPARNIVSPAVYSGKPDVFGTVALKVTRTPLDGKWERVEHAPVHGAAEAYASSLRSQDERERLQAINEYVNRKVHFVDDERQYGRSDVWATANTTLTSGRGDCEDYAIAKIQMARAAGFSDRDIYLVVLADLVRRSDHAVAVVRSGQHMYLLDNGTDQLLDTEAVSDYRPIFSFSAGGTWVHGYRVAAPVTTAAATSSPVAPAVSAATRALTAL
jgi:predicted transglutaminase-like cysteine proteinase